MPLRQLPLKRTALNLSVIRNNNSLFSKLDTFVYKIKMTLSLYTFLQSKIVCWYWTNQDLKK